MSLVQLADPDDRNGDSSPDLLAERLVSPIFSCSLTSLTQPNYFLRNLRDRYIEHLLHQLEQLSAEVRKIRSESQRQIGEMQAALQELEVRLAERESELVDALKGKEDIERKLSEAAQSAQLGSVVQLQLQVG